MENYIQRCSIQLTKNIEKAVSKGEKIDVKKYFSGYSLSVYILSVYLIFNAKQMTSSK